MATQIINHNTSTTKPVTKAVFRMPAYQLLCMQTWKGIAYTVEFQRVFDMLINYVHKGRAIIEVIDSSRLGTPHGRNGNVPSPITLMRNDPLVMEEIRSNLGIPVRDGVRINPNIDFVRSMRRAFQAKTIRGACVSCSFNEMCTRVSDQGFADAKLKLGQPQP